MTKLELKQIEHRINKIQDNLNNPNLSDCQVDYNTGELGLLIDLLSSEYNKARLREQSGLRLLKGGKQCA